jgi:hypothetical protein
MKTKTTVPIANAIAEARAPLKKLDKLVEMRRTPDRVRIAELSAGAGWQTHSVQGAMAGASNKRGHTMSPKSWKASAAIASIRRVLSV